MYLPETVTARKTRKSTNFYVIDKKLSFYTKNVLNATEEMQDWCQRCGWQHSNSLGCFSGTSKVLLYFCYNHVKCNTKMKPNNSESKCWHTTAHRLWDVAKQGLWVKRAYIRLNGLEKLSWCKMEPKQLTWIGKICLVMPRYTDISGEFTINVFQLILELLMNHVIPLHIRYQCGSCYDITKGSICSL